MPSPLLKYQPTGGVTRSVGPVITSESGNGDEGTPILGYQPGGGPSTGVGTTGQRNGYLYYWPDIENLTGSVPQTDLEAQDISVLPKESLIIVVTGVDGDETHWRRMPDPSSPATDLGLGIIVPLNYDSETRPWVLLQELTGGGDPHINAFGTIAVGATNIVADAAPDTLTLIAGTNITLTPDAFADSITIATTGGGGSGTSMSSSVTQTIHGFVVGNVLKYTGTAYARAQADVAANAEVVGLVSAVADANNFTLTTGGAVTGLSGLTAGSVYFLSTTTAGLLTTTAPTVTNQVSKPLLVATSTTGGYFFNWRGWVVGSAAAVDGGAPVGGAVDSVFTRTGDVLALSGDYAAFYEPLLGNPSVNGYILSSTTGGVRSWIVPPTGGGGIGGSTGATDNALLRADGTGGATLQSSGVTIDDTNNFSGFQRLYGTGSGNYIGWGDVAFGDMLGTGATVLSYNAANAIKFRDNVGNINFTFKSPYASAVANLASSYIFGWSSTASADGTTDTALARNAAGILEINNGSAGTYRDLKLRTLTLSGGTTINVSAPATSTGLFLKDNGTWAAAGGGSGTVTDFSAGDLAPLFTTTEATTTTTPALSFVLTNAPGPFSWFGNVTGGGAAAPTYNITAFPAVFIPAFTGDVTKPNGSLTQTIAANAVTYAKMQALSATSTLLGSSSTTTPVQEITVGSGLTLTGTTLAATAGGGGTVTDFSAGDLSPLFTTTEATTTTTPALSFALTSAGATTVFGRAAGTSGAPTYSTSPQFLAIGNLTSDGFIKTGGGVGTLSVDTATYLTTATAASTYQPLDTDLTTIAGLTATTDNFIIGVASAWASRTPAQARTSLGLVIGTNVQAWDTDLDVWATKTPYAGTVVVTTGKTFTSSNTLTLAGTDGSTLTIGTGGTLGTAAYTASSAYQPADADLTTWAGITPTTVGQSFVTLANPGAITFPEISATNVVSAKTAAQLKTDLSLTATDVGLGNVTNNAQTQAAIVPNTAPSAGQILIGNAGNTAYAKNTLSGSGATMSLGATGVLTISAIPEASLSITNVTTGDATTSAHGFAPKGTVGTTQFWRQDWTLATPVGTPAGGSNTFIQYNNSGAFGGTASLVYDNATANVSQIASKYLLIDLTDATKKATFDVSNIATVTTRTVNIPNANSTTVQTKASTGSQWLNSMSAQGVFTATQPNFTDLAGNYTLAQGPSTTASVLLGRTSASAGIPQEITLGSGLSMSGTTLSVSAGGGNVSSAGTPANDQIAVWTSASTIEGDAALTYSAGTLQITDATKPFLLLKNTSGTSDSSVIGFRDNTGAALWNIGNDTAGAGAQNFFIRDQVTSGTPYKIYIDTSGIHLPSTDYLGWSSVAGGGAGCDTAFGRNAAGVAEVNNGTLGTYRDLKLRTLSITGATTVNVSAPATLTGAFLKDDGTWAAPAGGGNVNNSGTPTVDQLGIWVTATAIKGVTALPAANFPALTGDVTTTAASLATTIGANKVTLGMMATLAADSIIGNTSASPATPVALTSLPFAFTGDVTRAADSNATVIATDAVTTAKILNSNVTYAKIQNVTATSRFLGRITAAAGVVEELTAANAKTILALTSSDVGLGSVTNAAQTLASVVPNTLPTAGQLLIGNAGATAYAPVTMGTDATITSAGALTIANNAVTLGKMATMATDSILGRKTAATGNVEVLTALPWSDTGDVTRAADGTTTTLANIPLTTTIAGVAGTRGDVLYYGASGWAKLAAGTSGNQLTTNGAGADPTWAAPGAGGSGSPGGSDTYVQFNDAGAFGGDAGLTYLKASTTQAILGLGATGGTLWWFGTGGSVGNSGYWTGSQLGIYNGSNTNIPFMIDSNNVYLCSSGIFGWQNAGRGGTLDTGLYRNAAGTVEINNGTAAQYRDLKARTVNVTSDLQVNGISTAADYLNSSVSSQSPSTSDVYLTGSSVVVPAGGFKAKGQYRCVFDVVKSAGTGAIVITLRIGTAGTTADTSRITFTFGSGTSVADTGTFEVCVNWRTVGSGTSAVVAGFCRAQHNLATTGLFNNAAAWTIVGTVSGGFDSSAATTMGLSFNGATTFAGTITTVQATLAQ